MSLFPIYDSRHPQYYERRAGYPIPSPNWYRNSDKKGNHVPMTFSKENFVQGFDLTCGEYYILREALVPRLLKDDLFKKKFNNPNVDYDILWPIFDKMTKHPLLQHDIHDGWKHHMLFRWITNFDTGFGYLPPENWKWGCDSLNPKNRAPYTLFKHINIRFTKSDGNETVIVVRVADLVEEDQRLVMGNTTDIDITHIELSRLKNIIRDKPDADRYVEFLHILRGNVYVGIEDDKQLQYAIR
ncbi:hypothetical protein IQ07DRAFT_624133 [Pyrenochaeta sp. DS3sAY3a]|nr:hypothetical protein IQ07DRAFT_624133 [Pyrenochaeta sp. DS3sAY3a]